MADAARAFIRTKKNKRKLINMTGEIVTLDTVLQLIIAAILGIIAWYNQQRTKAAQTTAIATVKTAETNSLIAAMTPPAPPALVIVTGPFDGNVKPHSSRAGTRVIMDDGSGSFQLIDDRIAQNFIVEGAGSGAGASGEFRFTGDLSKITHGKLL
jgi:hypothetical protein